MIFFPFIRMIVSPSRSPASAAGYPSVTPETTGLSYPIIRISTTAIRNARIKLNTGPAAITLILAHTDLLLKFPGASEASSSSPIMHNPPIGRSFRQYFVPLYSFENRFGPMPRANSSTSMPFFLASAKCPSS